MIDEQQTSEFRFLRRTAQRLEGENKMLRMEYARSQATIAELKLELLLYKHRHENDQAWLQRKVQRQKRALAKKGLSPAALEELM